MGTDHSPGRPEKTSALIARARKGDSRSLESLLVQHLPSLEAYVRLQAGIAVRGKESISDLVQSVCVEVLRDSSHFEYRGEAQFRHWLYDQVLHKIINKRHFYGAQKRDVRRERPSPATSSAPDVVLLTCYASICTPSRHAAGREELELFERAFGELPEDYRQAITMQRIMGLSYAEIAETMGRSEGAVRNLVYRGLSRLATLLEKGE